MSRTSARPTARDRSLVKRFRSIVSIFGAANETSARKQRGKRDQVREQGIESNVVGRRELDGDLARRLAELEPSPKRGSDLIDAEVVALGEVENHELTVEATYVNVLRYDVTCIGVRHDWPPPK